MATRPANGVSKRGQPTTANLRLRKRNASSEPLKLWQHLEVVWDDAWESEGAFKVEDLAEKCKHGCIRKDIGWLVYQDPKQIVLARVDERGDQSEAKSDKDCSNIARIPCGMIEEIIELEPKKRR